MILSSHFHFMFQGLWHHAVPQILEIREFAGSVTLAWFKSVAIYHQGRHLLYPSKVFTHYFRSVSFSLFPPPSGSLFCQNLQEDKIGMQNELQTKMWDLMMSLSSRLCWAEELLMKAKLFPGRLPETKMASDNNEGSSLEN